MTLLTTPAVTTPELTTLALQRRREPAGAVQPETRAAAGDGDVRAGCRHVDHERLDLRGRQGHQQHRQRPSGDNRPRSAGVRRLHPDRRQSGRPDRAQTRLYPGPLRLCRRRHRDDAGPEHCADPHFLGIDWRPWRFAPASGHAVPDPRQLRRRGPEAGLCLRGGICGDRRRRRTPARRVHHHVPLLARRLPAGSRHHRGRIVRNQAR